MLITLPALGDAVLVGTVETRNQSCTFSMGVYAEKYRTPSISVSMNPEVLFCRSACSCCEASWLPCEYRVRK